MQTVPHDLGFFLIPSTPCGLSSCSRNSPHFHCRFCTYGTSQIANAIAHGRLCSEMPSKDYQLSAEAIYQSAQPFSYYPPVSQNASSSSKIITTQQSTMLSFVLPTQNQFSGLYGPQTVFPNPSLFSPSGFSNYGQMDTSWVSQGRMLSSSITDVTSSNPASCCPLGVTSPDKLTNKQELQNPNWSAASSSQQKYLDPTAPCSISLLFLEHNKDSEECIDVDDICLTPKEKDTTDILGIESKNEGKELKDKCPSEPVCIELPPEHQNIPKSTTIACLGDVSPKKLDCVDEPPLSTSSNETDIVVEESDSESDIEARFKPCTVCETKPSINAFTPITETSPLTSSSRTPIYEKLATILDEKRLEKSFICSRCVNLVNLIDSLEMKLSVSLAELRDIHKVAQVCTGTQSECFDEDLACKICDKSFTSVVYFEKHLRNHTDSIKYCCEFCGKGFAGENQLENHVYLHQEKSDDLRFQCEVCGREFSDKAILTNHIERHKNEQNYTCNICRKKFRQKHLFREHVRAHRAKEFVCQHCGRQLKNPANLRVHVKACSGTSDNKCDKCDKKFPLKTLLIKHTEMDHKLSCKFRCEHCQKGFWKESDLNSHLTTHSNEKPFKCKLCGNEYKTKKNLNHHMKIHDSGQSCRFCGKNFTRSDALVDHINSHTGRQPYKCEKCGKKFANRINYNSHLKRHLTDGTGHKCLVCQEIIMGEMRVHLRTHREKQVFQCKMCDAIFAFKNSLMKHFKRKHSELLVDQMGLDGAGTISDICMS